jgi:transcriptional regulator NrdR family protein
VSDQSEIYYGGMLCPECGERTRIVDSRRTSGGVRRRRVCNGCEKRFTTMEIIWTYDKRTRKGVVSE